MGLENSVLNRGVSLLEGFMLTEIKALVTDSTDVFWRGALLRVVSANRAFTVIKITFCHIKMTKIVWYISRSLHALIVYPALTPTLGLYKHTYLSGFTSVFYTKYTVVSTSETLFL